MIQITSKRVQGKGKGSQIDFPTINMSLSKLPEGISIGLWATNTTWGNSITNISKSAEGFRLETFILTGSRYFNITVGTLVSLNFLKNLRTPSKSKDIYKLIESDKKLGTEYFQKLKTCNNCEFFSIQDYGYSNYTVEGSTYGCYAGKFEDVDGRDIEYTAIDCEYFSEGEPWEFDVDGEREHPSDEWIKSIKREVKLKSILNI